MRLKAGTPEGITYFTPLPEQYEAQLEIDDTRSATVTPVVLSNFTNAPPQHETAPELARNAHEPEVRHTLAHNPWTVPHLTSLPHQVNRIINEHIDLEDVYNLRVTCKKLRFIASNDSFGESILLVYSEPLSNALYQFLTL